MKKKLLTGALALALLAGGLTAAFSVSQSETLVSLSYMSGAFWNDLEATVSRRWTVTPPLSSTRRRPRRGRGAGALLPPRMG